MFTTPKNGVNAETEVNGRADLTGKRKNPIKKAALYVVAAVLLFGSGWAVGGGRVHVGSYDATKTNSGLPARLDYSQLDVIYNSLKDNFDGKLTESSLIDGMKSGLVKAAGDPYTEYFNVKDAKAFYGQLDGTFEGIGAELGKNENDNIIIVSPIAGYPARRQA